MTHLSISALTTEYVRVPVALLDSGQPVNPTSLPVQLAFPATDASPTDWITGSWETDSYSSVVTFAGVKVPIYCARALVGPGAGGTPLTAGSYDVWVKFISSPEIPVRHVGSLEVK